MMFWVAVFSSETLSSPAICYRTLRPTTMSIILISSIPKSSETDCTSNVQASLAVASLAPVYMYMDDAHSQYYNPLLTSESPHFNEYSVSSNYTQICSLKAGSSKTTFCCGKCNPLHKGPFLVLSKCVSVYNLQRRI